MRNLRALGLLLAIVARGADNQLQPSCNVSGSVVNAVTGEPVRKAQLTLSDTASENTYAAGSDDSGSFCLAAPEAGHYELLIQRRGFVQTGQTLTLTAGQTVPKQLIRIVPQGVIAGQVRDRDGEPLPGVTVQAIQARSIGTSERYSVMASGATNDLGEYRIYGLNPGRYYVGGAYRSESGYAAVYYPNVQEAGRAVSVNVSAGAEMHGVNLTIADVRSIRVRGILHHAAGLPVRGVQIVAAPCDAGPLNRATTSVQKPDGAFELRDLTPGCYILAADSFSGGKRYSARFPVNVAAQNIEDVNLNLVPPVQLAGTVRIQGANPPLRQVIVNLASRFSKVTASGASDPEGNVLINNVVPETYELNVVVPEGYYLKSAKCGDADAMRSGLDLSHGPGGRLELEIAADGGQIQGSVADAEGQPVEGARVALVPDDPVPSFRQKTAVTSAGGAFSIRGIAPGGYKLYASRNLQLDALRDPVYLKQLEPQAKAIAIHENGAEVLNVKALATDALFSR